MFLKRKHEKELQQEVESVRKDTEQTAREIAAVTKRQKEIESRLSYLQQELDIQLRQF